MGSSLEEYRCRLGLFISVRAKKTAVGTKSSFGLSFVHVPLAVLLFLLLIGGVDPNPGPTSITCKYCKSTFKETSVYFHHCGVHMSVKNFSVPCVYQTCHRKFTKLQTLQVHLSRNHKKVSRTQEAFENILTYTCPIATCGEILKDKKIFNSHMAGHLNEGKCFECPYEGCKTLHSKSINFKPHMSKYHRLEGLPGIRTPLQAELVPGTSSETNLDSVGVGSFEHDEDSEMCMDFSDLSVGNAVNEDAFPYAVVKEEIARFYLRLEGEKVLPSNTVQLISDEIGLLSRMSHHNLKQSLMSSLEAYGMKDEDIQHILTQSFGRDPVFNTHHKTDDMCKLSSIHLRREYIKKNYPYVEPELRDLGTDDAGKKRFAYYVPISETLKANLKDAKLKELILKSFTSVTCDNDIIRDFTDGEAFKTHMKRHPNGKCIQLFLFLDAFSFNPFGAGCSNKPVGVYYVIGNLPPWYRMRLDLINMVYMILENDLMKHYCDEDVMDDVSKMSLALKPLTDELTKLQADGIPIDGENVPVCCIFCIGDNLGSHQAGGFIQNFNAQFCCRYCPMSMVEFKQTPWVVKDLRTPEQYDECVRIAHRKWTAEKRKALRLARKAKAKAQKTASRSSAPQNKILLRQLIPKATLKKLRAINYRGVKYFPSPLNSIPGFHVCSPSMPACLAHDLFHGSLKTVVWKVLRHFILKKKYFDLKTLNCRIKDFKCKGSDANDKPKPLKSLENLRGNAVSIWNLARLLPFIIGDLIQDKTDPVWQLYLKLKEVIEYICAPNIKITQLEYLKILIQLYLQEVKKLLPSCLQPKQHFLAHYPDLIALFGPLIRLFTLRFESKHMFFKTVARACRTFKNILYTLTQKYQLRFAFDHSNYEILPPDIILSEYASIPLVLRDLPPKALEVMKNINLPNLVQFNKVKVRGILYETNFYLILDSIGFSNLKVGCIMKILYDPSTDFVAFLMRVKKATNSFNGYYIITEEPGEEDYCLIPLNNLLDAYALPTYEFQGEACITLKHSVICM